MTRPPEVKKFKAPAATFDRNALYYKNDFGGDWVYEPREPFTKIDVCKPGHFNAYRGEFVNQGVGVRITCRLGDIADGITEVDLQIIECPKSERMGDIMVSVKGRDGKFVPVRHDGTLAEDTTEKAA